jgi:hypothetical protein
MMIHMMIVIDAVAMIVYGNNDSDADRDINMIAAARSTAQHSTVQHSTAQHSTELHTTAQYSAVQNRTTHYSTAQHSKSTATARATA